MDIKQRVGGPVRPTTQSVRPSAPKRKLSKSWQIIIITIAVLAVAGLAAYQVLGVGSAIDKSKYQAVFLSNGQVYFGKLSGWGGVQPVLTDVYYFQADSTPSTGQAEEGAQQTTTQTLVKLGEEIHKPSDKLILNPDSVLFIENIEDDGQVVEAIKKNQENK